MLKIAICDDTREERELVEQYAKRYFDARKQPAEFEIFHSMQDVLDTGRACDLYLLDVLMPGKNGIQGAADLLKLYADPVIIFITSSLESAVDSYRVCASGFLLKPVGWEDCHSKPGSGRAFAGAHLPFREPASQGICDPDRRPCCSFKSEAFLDPGICSGTGNLSALPPELHCQSGTCPHTGGYLLPDGRRHLRSHFPRLL